MNSIKPLYSLKIIIFVIIIISISASAYNVNAKTAIRDNLENVFLQSNTFEKPDLKNLNDVLINDFSIINENQIETFSIKMPQLHNREKQILVFLPTNYKSTNQTYPVLYLQNAQEVFIYSYKENF